MVSLIKFFRVPTTYMFSGLRTSSLGRILRVPATLFLGTLDGFFKKVPQKYL